MLAAQGPSHLKGSLLGALGPRWVAPTRRAALFHEFKTAAQEQTNYIVPGHRFFKSEQTERRTTQEEDKHRRSVQTEEDKHRRSVNGGGCFRRKSL